jgi:hypothetical protein
MKLEFFYTGILVMQGRLTLTLDRRKDLLATSNKKIKSEGA